MTLLVLWVVAPAQAAKNPDCSFSRAAAVQIPDGDDALDLSPLLQVSPSEMTLETPEQALAAYRGCQFLETALSPGQGFSQPPLWLAFDLASPETQVEPVFILQVGPGHLDRITAYLAAPDGTVQELGHAGDQVPRQELGLPYLKPTFLLHRPDTGGHTVLLRIDNHGSHATYVRLVRGPAFPDVATRHGLLLGALLTIGALILAAAIWLYALLRQRVFLLWFTYVALLSCVLMLNNGVVYHYLPFVPIRWLNPLSDALDLISLAAGAAFLGEWFRIRSHSPWHRLLQAWIWLLLVLALAAVFWSAPALQTAMLISLPALLITMAALARLMWGRHPTALVLGPSLLVYLGATVCYMLASLGVVGLTIPFYWFWNTAGVFNLLLVQGLLFLQALTSQRHTHQERTQLLQMLSDKNQALEDKVRARTRDIELALRDVQKAEAEQRQLLSMASHEFRTPAAMIKISLDSLRFLADSIPPEVNQRLDNIRLASQRLTLLTNSLLVDNRLREPRLQIHLAPVAIDQMIRDVAAGYPSSTPLQLELPQAPVQIDADAALLSIALHNLIDNALNHGASSRPRVTVSLEDRGNAIILSVSDNGPGIPDAEKEKVFERFQRRDASRGSGLGLSIVSAILRAHGGSIRAQDNRPQGTRMVVTLNRKSE